MSDKSVTDTNSDSVVSTVASTKHDEQPKKGNDCIKKSDQKPPTPSKSRVYKQTYRTAWESVPDFKDWLRPVPGQPSRAHCIVCDRSLHAHRLNLLKHTCTLRHVKAAQKKYKQSKEATAEQESKKDKNCRNDELADQLDNGHTSDDEPPSNQSSPEPPAPVYPQPEPQHLFKGDNQQPPISTHVFDTAKGMPVTGLQVSLYKLIDGKWTHLSEMLTNPVGRCEDLINRSDLKPGRFKLHFDVDRYFSLRNQDTIFPFIEVVFDVRSPHDHYHIPLLLSPYGYTTFRGSNA